MFKSTQSLLIAEHNTDSIQVEIENKFMKNFALELIPDDPNYDTAAKSNSILHQLSHRRAQRIYNSDGACSAAEQAQLLQNHSKYLKYYKEHLLLQLYMVNTDLLT